MCVRAADSSDEDSCTGADEDTVHVWRGHEFDVEENGGNLSAEEFIDKVVQQYWGPEHTIDMVRIVEEEPGEESDDFINYFD